MVIGPIEIGALVVVILLLFALPAIIPAVGRRAGKVVERLRHVDDDVRDGRAEYEG